MLAANYNDPQTYRRTLMIHGGEAFAAFAHLVGRIIRRTCRQTERAEPSEVALAQAARALWTLIGRHGLPPGLPPGEQGEALDFPADRLAALLEEFKTAFQLPADLPSLEGPVAQLLAALFSPEFKKCRLSYKEPAADGACERQNLASARTRISGVHCADCPYWVSVTSVKNERLLAKEWAPARVGELTARLDVFLPEDFRALRQFLHMHTRFAKA